MGLTKEEVESLRNKPIRNRRNVNNYNLNKREKAKILRKEKKRKINEMIQNTKLNMSMSIHNKLNKTEMPKHKGIFNMDDILGQTDNIFKDIIKTDNNKQDFRKKGNNLLYIEKDKILHNVQKNNTYNNMNKLKTYIINEQNKQKHKEKSILEYNKNFNLLGMK